MGFSIEYFLVFFDARCEIVVRIDSFFDELKNTTRAGIKATRRGLNNRIGHSYLLLTFSIFTLVACVNFFKTRNMLLLFHYEKGTLCHPQFL